MTEIRVVGVEPWEGRDFTLRIRWANGREWGVSLHEPVFRLKGLRPLRDSAVFARAAVGEGGHSIAWPGGQDMGADRVWEMSLEQNGHEDAADFLRWRWKNGLSLSGAAKALDLSRRMIAYYSSGEAPVTHVIRLACVGWEAEQKSKGVAAA
jgi:hypothetical protein